MLNRGGVRTPGGDFPIGRCSSWDEGPGHSTLKWSSLCLRVSVVILGLLPPGGVVYGLFAPVAFGPYVVIGPANARPVTLANVVTEPGGRGESVALEPSAFRELTGRLPAGASLPWNNKLLSRWGPYIIVAPDRPAPGSPQ